MFFVGVFSWIFGFLGFFGILSIDLVGLKFSGLCVFNLLLTFVNVFGDWIAVEIGC